MKREEAVELWKVVPIREKIKAVIEKTFEVASDKQTPVDLDKFLDDVCYSIKDEIESLEKEKNINLNFTLDLLVEEFFKARPALIQPQKVREGYMFPPGWGSFIEYLYNKLREVVEDWRLGIEDLRLNQLETHQLRARIKQLEGAAPAHTEHSEIMREVTGHSGLDL